VDAIRDLIRKKGNEIWSVSPDATVYQALDKMAQKNVGAMLVMNGEDVVGILSERDVARKVELQGKTVRETQVREIMTEKVVYVEADQPLEECLAVMLDKNIRHLPVFENGKLVGLISVRDALKGMVDTQKFLISQLEHYITGGGR
jgi:CBS domain-containing protein